MPQRFERSAGRMAQARHARSWPLFVVVAAVVVGASACPGCAGVPLCAADAPAATTEDNLPLLDRLSADTFFEGLEARAFARDRVVVCTGVQSALLFDATDPAALSSPVRLTSSASDPSFPRCQHVASAGDIVFFSNRGDEVQPTSFVAAIDVATSPPREIAVLSTTNETFEGIDADGTDLFAAKHEAGVGIYRLSGDRLDELATFADGVDNAWSVRFSDDKLYIAAGPAGLVIADVSDRGSPAPLSSLVLGGAALSLEVDADRGLVFVATGASGVAVVDVSDATAPVLVSRIDTPGSALDLAIAGDHLVVADWGDLRVYDVTTPSAPRPFAVERPSSSSRVLGAAAIGDVAFASEWKGLTSYRVRAGVTAPDLYLDETEVSFGDVAAGEERARAFLIANHGNAPLQIGGAAASSDVFTVATALPLTLEPGEEGVLEVIARPDIALEASAQLDLCSDDPDEPGRSARLIVNPAFTTVGDPAPVVEVELTSGETWRLADARGSVVVLSYFATF